MTKKFADIHCHPSMKPYSIGIQDITMSLNSTDARDEFSIWHTNSNWGQDWRRFAERFLMISKYKQADMTQLEDGNVELVVLSITPPELGFIRFDRQKVPALARVFLRSDDALFNFVTEFGVARGREIGQGEFSYFYDLEREYHYITQLNGVRTLQGKKYLLAERGQDIMALMEQNQECVVAVLSIEGAHALLPFVAENFFEEYTPLVDDLQHPKTQKLLEIIRANIAAVKGWENGKHCPLFLTLNHHFWNLFAGHSPSLAGMLTDILDQTTQVNRGMTALGREVVKELLSTQNGPRILIDTRHMSIQARRWYLNYINQHNTRNLQDPIPIISSHSAANGFTTMTASELHEVYFDNGKPRIIANAKYDKSKKFNNWSLNVSDEEAIQLFESGGLLGISMDQRVLTGKEVLKDIQWNNSPSAWAKPFFNQVSHFYHLFYRHSGGDVQRALGTLCLGSDFDGIMNPLNHFGTARDLNFLKQELHGYIVTAQLDRQNPDNFPGTSAKAVTDAVLFGSAQQFIQKWFV